MKKTSPADSYRSSLFLLASLFIGSLLGLILKEKASFFKPFGDVFLNLLFTIVVPLVFFSIASVVASMAARSRLGKIFGWMLVIYLVTSAFSSLLMLVAVKMYPPAQGVAIAVDTSQAPATIQLSDALVKAFTVSDFSELLSKKNMLALIVFSMLVGFATAQIGEKGRAFREFLTSANEVMSKLIGFIMSVAPIGLGAYFAYLVGVLGPELFGSYLRAMQIYYPIALLYFFGAFTLYAFIAAGRQGVKRFWTHIVPPSLTALGTGSSVATIPTNLEAAKRIGIPEDVREVVVLIGASIHTEGSCLSAVLKTAFLFGLYNMPFATPETLLTAIGVAILSGTVMSGIPSGGFLGEIMIITVYGFPIEALPIISMIGVLVDPPATMVNAVGDTVAGMLVARVLNGPDWLLHESV